MEPVSLVIVTTLWALVAGNIGHAALRRIRHRGKALELDIDGLHVETRIRTEPDGSTANHMLVVEIREAGLDRAYDLWTKFDGRRIDSYTDALADALLDERARSYLQRLDELQISRNGFEARLITWATRRLAPKEAAEVFAAVVARAKSDPDLVPGRLEAMVAASGDVETARVAALAMEALVTRFPAHAATARAVARAMASEDVGLRVAAATRAGAAGLAVLTEAAKEDELPVLQLRALEALVRTAREEDAAPIVASVLEGSKNPSTIEAALELLVERRWRSVLPALASLVGRGHRSLGMVRVLAALDGPEATALLARELDSSSSEIVAAAADALGRRGDRDAAAALHARLERGWVSRDAKRALELAIELVQARLGDPDAGRLSLTDGGAAEGSLSFTSGGGELSVPKEGGELTLVSKGDPSKR